MPDKYVAMFETVGLGLGIVFAGLVCIVILISLMNFIFTFIKPKEKEAANNAVQSSSSADDRLDSETVAAISAAVAETMGRDVTGIRITSIKKVN